MKTMGPFVVTVLFVVLAATPLHAQSPAGPHDHAQPSAAQPTAAKGPGMPMMDMCRDMMTGMSGMGMMGPGAAMDPKERAAMLEMRGEMMKAMGEVMMKHARGMRETPAK
jgi:hypothetical protein